MDGDCTVVEDADGLGIVAGRHGNIRHPALRYLVDGCLDGEARVDDDRQSLLSLPVLARNRSSAYAGDDYVIIASRNRTARAQEHDKCPKPSW